MNNDTFTEIIKKLERGNATSEEKLALIRGANLTADILLSLIHEIKIESVRTKLFTVAEAQ
ncbi:MAG: hypothetical protein WC878_06845 [Candidatus Paceibacterota bacterium]|jgi:hypothetical protein